MIASKEQPYAHGYNVITGLDGPYSDMLMDFGVVALDAGISFTETRLETERTYLLMNGSAEFRWNGMSAMIGRRSFLDLRPHVLHVPQGVLVAIRGVENGTQIAVAGVKNSRSFEPKLYLPTECRSELFGNGRMHDTATREARTVIDTTNAPHAGLVIGEIITWPGKWSSYPPHLHRHPEIYHYRFSPHDGFGVSFVGDSPAMVRDGFTACIPGDLTHAQCAAPGYAMYYIWVIPHLPGDPWIREASTTVVEKYRWLNDPQAAIWDGFSSGSVSR